MEITEEQYARIKDSLPVQRGNVSLSNLQVLNAILYVVWSGNSSLADGQHFRGTLRPQPDNSSSAFRPSASDVEQRLFSPGRVPVQLGGWLSPDGCARDDNAP